MPIGAFKLNTISKYNSSITPVSSLTYVTNVTISNNPNITIPGTILDGDLCFYYDFAYTAVGVTTVPTAVTPTGFTNVLNISSAPNQACRAMLSYKILTTSDQLTSPVGMNSTSERKILLIFRPNKTITTVTPVISASQATSATPASQTLSIDTTTEALVTLATYSTTTGPFSRQGDGTEVGLTYSYLRYQLFNQNQSRSNSVVSQTDGGSNALSSLLFKIT